jgi:hypothetical protein
MQVEKLARLLIDDYESVVAEVDTGLGSRPLALADAVEAYMHSLDKVTEIQKRNFNRFLEHNGLPSLMRVDLIRNVPGYVESEKLTPMIMGSMKEMVARDERRTPRVKAIRWIDNIAELAEYLADWDREVVKVARARFKYLQEFPEKRARLLREQAYKQRKEYLDKYADEILKLLADSPKMDGEVAARERERSAEMRRLAREGTMEEVLEYNLSNDDQASHSYELQSVSKEVPI